MVTELINKYQELHTKYEEKCDDYDNEVESRRTWQNAAKTSEREMVALRQASVRKKETYKCSDARLTLSRAARLLSFAYLMAMALL